MKLLTMEDYLDAKDYLNPVTLILHHPFHEDWYVLNILTGI